MERTDRVLVLAIDCPSEKARSKDHRPHQHEDNENHDRQDPLTCLPVVKTLTRDLRHLVDGRERTDASAVPWVTPLLVNARRRCKTVRKTQVGTAIFAPRPPPVHDTGRRPGSESVLITLTASSSSRTATRTIGRHGRVHADVDPLPDDSTADISTPDAASPAFAFTTLRRSPVDLTGRRHQRHRHRHRQRHRLRRHQRLRQQRRHRCRHRHRRPRWPRALSTGRRSSDGDRDAETRGHGVVVRTSSSGSDRHQTTAAEQGGVGDAGRDLLDVVGDEHERRRGGIGGQRRRAGPPAARGHRGRDRRPARRGAAARARAMSARARSTCWRSPSESTPKGRSAASPEPGVARAARRPGRGRPSS